MSRDQSRKYQYDWLSGCGNLLTTENYPMKNKLTAIIAGTMLAATGTTLPAAAAGPNFLNHAGSNHTYPTWYARHTKLCIRSLDPNHWGKVTIKAGLQQEELGTGGGATNCIDRHWVGIRINVTNSRHDLTVPVQVWTE
jgi:hypothetical protein